MTTMQSPTGAALALYQLRAEGEPRGVVHINHGLAEHAARYGAFALHLSRRGYHVYAQDHRGHGRTSAPDAPPRVFGGWDKVLDDAAAVNQRIRSDHPGLPIVIFGHSLGGEVALGAIVRAPETVKAAAIWNANVTLGPMTTVMRLLLGLESLVGGAGRPSGVMNALTFADWNRRFRPNRTRFDWLSSDPDAVDAYVADPLCGWPASIAMWRDISRGIDFAGSPANLRRLPKDMPIQLVGGGQDPATDGGKAVAALADRMTRAGLRGVETTILPEARHETLNEREKEAAYALFADWADRAVAD